MRIISKFRDYYDTAQGYGIDQDHIVGKMCFQRGLPTN